MVWTLLLLTRLALADPGEPVCQGPLDLRIFDVPITTYSMGVATTTHTTSWTVLDADHRPLDTLSLARALGDSGVEAELGRRQKKARRTGWIVTGVSAVATLVGVKALDSGVDGDGGDGAIAVGATLLGLGGTGLLFGPIWLGVRPWALKNNPAAFYPMEEIQEKLAFYDHACRS